MATYSTVSGVTREMVSAAAGTALTAALSGGM